MSALSTLVRQWRYVGKQGGLCGTALDACRNALAIAKATQP
jgi:hypothetical protein